MSATSRRRAGPYVLPRARRGTIPHAASALAALLGLLLVLPAAAQAPNAFTIAGRVVNGTAGGDTPREGRVQIYAYTRERVDGPWEGEVDEVGGYRVDGVPRVEGAIYVVGIDYGGALYAERLDQPVEDALITRDLTVYSSSAVDPGIQFEQVAILLSAVDGTQGVISVVEIHRLDNPTDRTFAPSASGPGGPAGLLVFPLPPNAFDLRADVGIDPARLIQIDRGFASLAPVPPGRTEISFSYRFPYTDTTFQLNRTVRYPISRLSVLVPQDGPTVESDGLTGSDTASFGGRPYRSLTGGPLAAGQAVQVNISNLSVPGGPLGRVPPAAAAVTGIILGVGVLIAAALRPRPGGEALSVSEDAVVDGLVALELDLAESRISDDEYRQARQALVQRLRPSPNLEP